MFKENIFKAYDIRGIFNSDFDQQFAYDLGFAFVNLRRQELSGKKITLVVAADMRTSSPEIKKALIEGMIFAGGSVIDAGTISTPTFYFAVSNSQADGGIMVSASHNPKEWNGFKITRERALPVSGESGLQDLKNLINHNQFSETKIKGEVIVRNDFLELQIAHDFSLVSKEGINSFSIALDPANGMGAQYLQEMFFKLNCELHKINFELDGNFPNHEADPLKPENIEPLREFVLDCGADLGIATDGDGDRIFFVDNEGQVVNPAIVRGVLAKLFLADKPGSKIAYDVRPGKITKDLIEENGGTPIITRVGHSLIKEQMLKDDAYFAGESSGHFFLNDQIGCFEMPVVMILKILKDLSVSGLSSAEYFGRYNKYFQSGEINLTVEDKEKVFDNLKKKYSDGKMSSLDGISIEYPEYWFNVRASNTENVVRLNLEALDFDLMKEKRDEVLEVIKK
ncbi:MAG: phosphomannomutase/phosphoglucomutase [Patescibacteria group bacterium]|nr:phosphomannomutase/phosphoglucomutase [Patescibacteria group bacterium]